MMMPDREKIIRGIERCLVCNTSAITSAEGEKAYRECEYTVALYCRQDKLLRDVLTLLKGQEPVKPDVDSEGTCTCGNCGENVGWYPVGSKEPVMLCKFCSECGQAVKWE